MRVHDAVKTALGRKDLIAPRENMAMRRDGAHGVVTGILGRKNQLILVLHEGASTPAVYLEEELLFEPHAYWKVTYVQQGCGFFEELATYDDVCDLLVRLEDDGVLEPLIEGPFFSDKELTEGLIPARSLFDRLKLKHP